MTTIPTHTRFFVAAARFVPHTVSAGQFVVRFEMDESVGLAPFERRLSPTDFGPWFYEVRRRSVHSSVIDVRGVMDPTTGLTHVTEVASPASDDWFDLGNPSVAALQDPRQRVDAALAFVNDYRRRHAQRLLDPVASGWSSDDVVVEAQRLGWSD